MNMKKQLKSCLYCQKKVPKDRKIYCSYECSWRDYKRKNRERIYKQWREYYERRKKKDPNWLHKTYERRKFNEPNYWEKRKKYGKISRAKIRKEVIEHYGGKCKCCGETVYEFLGIDHINGRGTKHRKSISYHIYSWLRRNNYPKGYQVLCHNRNLAKGFYGDCPHKKRRI